MVSDVGVCMGFFAASVRILVSVVVCCFVLVILLCVCFLCSLFVFRLICIGVRVSYLCVGVVLFDKVYSCGDVHHSLLVRSMCIVMTVGFHVVYTICRRTLCIRLRIFLCVVNFLRFRVMWCVF